MPNEQLVTLLFLTFVTIKLITQFYLSLRNQKYVQNHQAQVPEYFADKITLDDHQKAARYTLIKSKVGLLFLLIDFFILLFWTLGGGLQFLDTWLRSFGFSTVLTGTLLLGVFSLINMFLGLPETLYSTFVIEERFGFNRMTKQLFFTDLIKQMILGALLGLPLAAGIIAIMQASGPYWWLYAWMFFTIFQLLLLWAYPAFLAPLFNKFSPLEEGPVKEKIIALLQRTQFAYQGLYVMDASKRSAHGNAYFTGLGKNKRIVFFDTLLKTLTPDETEAVLAHELGHFKLKHILKNMVKSIFLTLVGLWILGQLEKATWFYLGHGVTTSSPYMALLLFMLVSSVYTFLLTPIFSWASRKHEFEADEYAHRHSNARQLITALSKMYKDNASTLTPDPIFSLFYHSHPPALIRVQHLENILTKS